MPYLPLDLDAKRKLEAIERGLGLPRHTMVGGTMELWEGAWRSWMGGAAIGVADVADELAMTSAFGSDSRVCPALVSRGFLEAVPGGWRIRGAAKWLFGLEGKSRGGKTAKGNLKQGSQPGTQPGNQESEKADFPAKPGPKPEDTSRLDPRLLHPAPSTQHPKEEKREAPPPLNPVVAVGGLRVESVAAGAVPGRRIEDRPTTARVPTTVVAPTKDPEVWDGDDFWCWAQSVRQDGGLLAEAKPRALGSWFNTCLMTEGVTAHALKEAFYAFGEDPYWEAQRFPFQAFMSQWASFARKDSRHAAAS